MDSVIHFEITARDVARLQEFYKRTFGWNFNDMPELDYSIAITTELDQSNMPKKPGAINGGVRKQTPKIKNPVITINVEDIDMSMQNIKDNGGKIILGKQSVSNMGFTAYFQDTEGNVLGLWQSV